MTILKSYWSALMSNAGGTEQAMHQDFTEHGTWPRFAGIISLDEGKIWMERLDLKGDKVELSLGAGDAVIFQGDKMHAGSAYDEEHRRLYFKALSVGMKLLKDEKDSVGYCHVCEDDKLGGLIVCQFTVRRK